MNQGRRGGTLWISNNVLGNRSEQKMVVVVSAAWRGWSIMESRSVYCVEAMKGFSVLQLLAFGGS